MGSRVGEKVNIETRNSSLLSHEWVDVIFIHTTIIFIQYLYCQLKIHLMSLTKS